jgi:hypothetical protein
VSCNHEYVVDFLQISPILISVALEIMASASYSVVSTMND